MQIFFSTSFWQVKRGDNSGESWVDVAEDDVSVLSS